MNIKLADRYERSLMHREALLHVTLAGDFLITASIDGHVKFWKKTEKGIEFVKHFRAHLSAIVALSVSVDNLLATASDDKTLKIFDVYNFDMINMIELNYVPEAVTWMYNGSHSAQWIACSEKESQNIYIYNGKDSQKDPLFIFDKIHKHTVHILSYSPFADTVISCDNSGMVEYWQMEEDEEGGKHCHPTSVQWKFKTDTDLYEFKKQKVVPTSLNFAKDYSKFVTFSLQDRKFRIFNFFTAKMIKVVDESLQTIQDMHKEKKLGYVLDDMEFGRRLALDKEIEKDVKSLQRRTMNAVFDDTGNVLIYPTLLGIKFLDIQNNKVVQFIGKSETHRFMNVAYYQGAPKRKAFKTLEMAASDNPALKDTVQNDPTLFCTALKRNRFFLFTSRDPESSEASVTTSRDIYNEKPSREEQTMAAMSQITNQSLCTSAIIHTSLGDIHLRLFPESAPKAVENFVGLAKKGYYDNVIFHRVIKNFMLQTGDPLGDGTGGESLWGTEFEDEFHKGAKHDRPYTLSMANCGPNTNGSQFFITTVATPWLDNKHTVFGRATGGLDVIHLIENAKTDKSDKPYKPIKILSIEAR